MKSRVPAKEQPKFILRFPSEELRDSVAEAAKAAGVSMNTEIIRRLSESFDPERLNLGTLLAKQTEVQKTMAAIEARMEEMAERVLPRRQSEKE